MNGRVTGGKTAMIAVIGAVLGAMIAAHLALDLMGMDLGAARILALISGAAPERFEEAAFLFGALPRLAMAALIGAALGLAGSLIQQVTQNPLVSPMTMGVSSGAWLALVLAAIFLPDAARSDWIALGGAAVAGGLVLAIIGPRGVMGLQAPLAGMAVNLLFGSMAATAMLLANPYTEHLFLWGAGDLGQTGWDWVLWILPRTAFGVTVAVLLVRPLGVLRLGAQGAGARGLVVWPVALAAGIAALHLAAISVTAAGMIGFIGLVAPSLARLIGGRLMGGFGAGAELAASAALGAACLIGADAMALGLSRVLPNIVPTGATAALIGAGALIWLLRRKLGAQDHAALSLTQGAGRIGVGVWVAVGLAMAVLGVAALALGRGGAGWGFDLADPVLLSLRWPRVLGAAAAGAGMALAGTILQRVIRNPLASPDILGMSSGAVAALVGYALVTGGSIHSARLTVALAGCAAALGLLLWFGRRHSHAPAALALIGIALGAALDSLVRLSMASGTAETFAILGWMSGSTYRIEPQGAVWLAVAIGGGCILALAAQRPLTLLGAGDAIALGRGVELVRMRRLLMLLAAALAAAVTGFMGPVSFVGLVGPHLAALLGARRTRDQLCLAPVLGAGVMILSDWVGRMVLYPNQLPAGAMASVLGGSYFLLLLARRRAI